MHHRIALISEHASPLAALGGIDAGGQNVYVGELAKQLSTLGYRVDVFTRMDNSKLPAVVKWMPGIRVIHVKAGPASFVPKEQLLSFMPEFRDEMIRFIKADSLQYALVHANFFMSAWVASQLKTTLNIPFVVTFHALGHVRRIHQGDADQFPKERLAIEEEIVQHADRIIAECPQDKKDLIQYYNAPPERIAMIPCGFDPCEFYPVDKQLARMLVDIHPEEFIVLQLGRMVPRKGVDNVIEAMGLIKDKITSLRLVIVGGEEEDPDKDLNPEMARLRNIAKQKGIEAQVTFTGRRNRERLKYYYSAADVFITTPWYEPFGITPLEAMACGTPVIGADVGGVKYSVANDTTGFLIPPKNPAALAEKIETLINQPQLCKKMGEQAIRRVNSLFTWTCVARKMSVVYEDILLSTNKHAHHTTKLQLIEDAFNSAAQTIKIAGQTLQMQILSAANCMAECLRRGNKIMICGSGSSMIQSQQFAAGLLNNPRLQSSGKLSAVAFSADVSAMGYRASRDSSKELFSRQVEAYGKSGDILICLSINNNNQDIISAMEGARKRGIRCIGLLGKDGGEAIQCADINITVPSIDKQRIQELHLNIIHMLLSIVENESGTNNTTNIARLHASEDINIAV